MSDDVFPPLKLKDHPKTAECFQCGGRDGFDCSLEETVWIKVDGSIHVRPHARFQCVDRARCDVRIQKNTAKARILGTGPVKV